MTNTPHTKNVFWRWRMTDLITALAVSTGGAIAGAIQGDTVTEIAIQFVGLAVLMMLIQPLLRHLMHGDKDPGAR